MTITNIAVAGLESFQPAVDYRRSGRIGVLDGKNFAWDASGVYSAYASRLVSGSDSIVISPNIVQDLDLETDVHIGVITPASTWRIDHFIPSSDGSPVGSWETFATIPFLVYNNPANIPYDLTRATTSFLGNKRFACSYNFGVFEVNLAALPIPTYTRLTSGTVPGFPADDDPVVAICETNGRQIYMTRLVFYWSGANNPTDLNPALGGAGFQVIAERVAGVPMTVTPVSNGCIIWTSAGALVCEFIGGDSVFRFWTLSTEALPLTSYSVVQLPDDDYLILARLGLYRFSNLSQPTPATPLFNEFLREYLRIHPTEKGHLWYSIAANRLYVGMRSQFQPFARTYALDIVLDRWGTFDMSHLGIFEYGLARGQIAYANIQGVVSFLLSPLDSRKNREDPANPGVMIGLGSYIIIGWMRAENLIYSADVVMEVQEIVINRLTPFGEALVTHVDEGLMTDPVTVAIDEGHITDLVFTSFDEGLITTGEEIIAYQLQVITDLFAFDSLDGPTNTIIPYLVKQNIQLDLWTTHAPTAYARLKFIADQLDEFYRMNSLDMTVAYFGNQA